MFGPGAVLELGSQIIPKETYNSIVEAFLVPVWRSMKIKGLNLEKKAALNSAKVEKLWTG
jgi:hypothetical protein